MKYLLVLGLVLFTALPAAAQRAALRKPAITGDLVKDLKTDFAQAGPSGADPLAALEAKFNAKLRDDLTVALAMAQQKDAQGQMADSTAASCYQALLDLNGLINNLEENPSGAVKPADPTVAAPAAGVVAHFEQLRILRNALQNQHFKDACAPLVQDIQASGTQLLSQILAVVGGAAKLGIVIP